MAVKEGRDSNAVRKDCGGTVSEAYLQDLEPPYAICDLTLSQKST